MNIEQLARKVVEKRGGTGVRKTAAEVGISPATLSRIENGKVPDLETFSKICRWLGDDPSEFLGLSSSESTEIVAQVHFKKDSAIDPDTATALTDLIIHAHTLMKDDWEFGDV